MPWCETSKPRWVCISEILASLRDLDDEAKAFGIQALRILAILGVAWILQALAERLVRIFRSYIEARTGKDELPRIETLARVFRNTAAIVIVLVAGMLILGEFGISIAPILATAGVAGIAIGFGAQALIKDYFAGFFLLLEDQLREGDTAEVAGKSGVVEEVTLRYVRLRDAEGRVIFIPNGEIKVVVNNTRGHAYAIIDAAISAKQDVNAALAIIRELAEALRKDAVFGPQILGDVELWGVERWELWGIGLRFRIKVVPSAKDGVRREILKRLVAAFEARGVQMP